MKRLIPILFLLFLPTTVMGEEIVLTCRDKDRTTTYQQSLKLNLKTNKVQFGGPPASDIYFKSSEYIVWIEFDNEDIFVLRTLYRKTGRLRINLTNLTTIYDTLPNASDYWSQQFDLSCFRTL